jgi:hypothetical protein
LLITLILPFIYKIKLEYPAGHTSKVIISANQEYHRLERPTPEHKGISSSYRDIISSAIKTYGAKPVQIRKALREKIVEESVSMKEREKRFREIPDLKTIQNFAKRIRKLHDGDIATLIDLEKW